MGQTKEAKESKDQPQTGERTTNYAFPLESYRADWGPLFPVLQKLSDSHVILSDDNGNFWIKRLSLLPLIKLSPKTRSSTYLVDTLKKAVNFVKHEKNGVGVVQGGSIDPDDPAFGGHAAMAEFMTPEFTFLVCKFIYENEFGFNLDAALPPPPPKKVKEEEKRLEERKKKIEALENYKPFIEKAQEEFGIGWLFDWIVEKSILIDVRKVTIALLNWQDMQVLVNAVRSPEVLVFFWGLIVNTQDLESEGSSQSIYYLTSKNENPYLTVDFFLSCLETAHLEKVRLEKAKVEEKIDYKFDFQLQWVGPKSSDRLPQ